MSVFAKIANRMPMHDEIRGLIDVISPHWQIFDRESETSGVTIYAGEEATNSVACIIQKQTRKG